MTILVTCIPEGINCFDANSKSRFCTCSKMDKVINLDIPHIGELIFQGIDTPGLIKCLEVSETWKILAENVLIKRIKSFKDKMDGDGYSLLQLACIYNQPETVQFLLDSWIQFDIDINATDRNGWTLLHLAAKHGHDKVAKILLEASLEHDINVNAYDFQKLTPFTIACINGHLEVAKLMIQQSRIYEIDLNLFDYMGNSAMHYAIKNKHLEIARVMIDESKAKGIFLNRDYNSFRRDLLYINAWVSSIGGLVYGRRPDLWNPLVTSYFITRTTDIFRKNAQNCLIKILKLVYFHCALCLLWSHSGYSGYFTEWLEGQDGLLPFFQIYLYFKHLTLMTLMLLFFGFLVIYLIDIIILVIWKARGGTGLINTILIPSYRA